MACMRLSYLRLWFVWTCFEKARPTKSCSRGTGSSSVANGQRPAMETEILFRGIHGRLELDLRGKDKAQAGRVAPTFYSLAGETGFDSG